MPTRYDDTSDRLQPRTLRGTSRPSLTARPSRPIMDLSGEGSASQPSRRRPQNVPSISPIISSVPNDDGPTADSVAQGRDAESTSDRDETYRKRKASLAVHRSTAGHNLQGGLATSMPVYDAKESR
ncbi:MAG: hypothetical protein Q9174_007523, partial [Haloplaca sp. 1 TL-2023]